MLGPLPEFVHAYFHDYDLLEVQRRVALVMSLTVLGRRSRRADALALAQ